MTKLAVEITCHKTSAGSSASVKTSTADRIRFQEKKIAGDRDSDDGEHTNTHTC